jgi:hypothetical protein
MVSDPKVLRERAIRYRTKAAELRARAKHLGSTSGEEFLDMARDYDEMADQLEAIAGDFR